MRLAENTVVSFVVPTRNRAELLEKTLRSIQTQNAGVVSEILVVDNASTDETCALVRRAESESPVPIRFFIMEENRGPAASRNFGARQAKGEFIAFVDSDVELRADWLSEMLSIFNTYADVGIAAGTVVFASAPGVIHCFGGELSRIGLGWDGEQGELAGGFHGFAAKLWAPSASLIVRRRAFLDVGGFDDEYFYGYEDSDLGWRFNLEGWRCLCVAGAVSYHATSTRIDDSVKKIGPEIVFHYSKNRVRSMIKNYGGSALSLYLPIALLYSIVDAALRPPRPSRWKALLWNLIHLRQTLNLRRVVQQRRRKADQDLWPLFAPQFFPKTPITRRMMQMQDFHETSNEAERVLPR